MSGELVEQDGTTPLADGEGPDKPTGKLGRRALMLGAATGAGAAVALVAGASPAGALNGDTVTVGNSVSGTLPTKITNTDVGAGINGVCHATSGVGPGIAGIWGDSDSAPGVTGTSSSASDAGVFGYNPNGIGTYGLSLGTSGLAMGLPGVMGESSTSPGVSGFSIDDNGVYGASSGGNGVCGTINNDPTGLLGGLRAGVVGDVAGASGVIGLSEAANGIVGLSSGSTGVLGAHNNGLPNVNIPSGVGGTYYGQEEGDNGCGVSGFSDSGPGVYGLYETSSGLIGPANPAGVIGDTNYNSVAGVVGASSGGDGVIGLSSGSDYSGVYGNSVSGDGVHGINSGTSGIISGPAGVLGDSDANPGVVGVSTASDGVRGIKSGLSGLDGGPAGVTGDSSTNTGVAGISSGGPGVYGQTSADNQSGVQGSDTSGTGGFGVVGFSEKGVGVSAATTLATNPNPALKALSAGTGPAVQATGKTVPVSGSVPIAGNGAALNVQGVASFTRSGVVTLAAAGTSVLVPVPGGLKGTSHVLATVQALALTTPGSIGVLSAFPNPATGKVTINFTGTAPKNTEVAWFVFG